jgi:hypothetical protein
MTAARRRAAPHQAAGSAELAIGAMTIRGRGLSGATGQSLAAAVAEALARQLAGRNRPIGAMTVRMPASMIDRNGGIDRAALAQAIARTRREPHA